jgi:hypothetical protein
MIRITWSLGFSPDLHITSGKRTVGLEDRLVRYVARAFRVRAAFFAEADRCAGPRFRAAARACLESASFDAAVRPSRLSAVSVACERLRDGLALPLLFAFLSSCLAFRRVSSGTLPFFGTGSFTPARLAFERPMAIACLAERAPCSPLRIDSISSRTNSPACVEADFPSRLSRRARSMVCFFGMMIIPRSFRRRRVDCAYEKSELSRCFCGSTLLPRDNDITMMAVSCNFEAWKVNYLHPKLKESAGKSSRTVDQPRSLPRRHKSEPRL